MATKISRCDCKHSFQDKIYGQGNRVFNMLPLVNGKTPEGRCTVCGKERAVKNISVE